MKKHKFKGRELVECLKRLTLLTVNAGDILVREGEPSQGFYIIVNGQLSKHFTLKGKVGQAMKDRVRRVSAVDLVMDENYPRYMNRQVRRIDSMDFSPDAMLKDI